MKASCNSSRAASKCMDNINDDLLTEILIRLPDCRHAVRCAAVCKRWSSLISDSQFIRSFVDHRNDSDYSAASPLALLLEKHHYEYQKLPIIDPKYYQILVDDQTYSRTNSYLSFLPYDDVVIRAYFDDLLLVSRANADYAGIFSFCICNPMTKKWCELPEPPRGIVRLAKCALVCRRSSQDQGRYCYNVTLLFFMTRGRGYSVVGNRVQDKVWASVFSSEIGLWSSLAEAPVPPQLRRWSPLATAPLPPHLEWWSLLAASRVPLPLPLQRWNNISGDFLIFNQPVSCSNGALYWLEGRFDLWEWVVVFDPYLAAASADDGRVLCQLIDRPAEAGHYPELCFVRLGAFKGRLQAALLSHNSADRMIRLQVWELIDDNKAVSCGGWSLVRDVALEIEVESKFVCLLALHPGNRDVVFLLIDKTQVFVWDLSSRAAPEKVGQLPERVQACDELIIYPLCSSWPTPLSSLQST